MFWETEIVGLNSRNLWMDNKSKVNPIHISFIDQNCVVDYKLDELIIVKSCSYNY